MMEFFSINPELTTGEVAKKVFQDIKVCSKKEERCNFCDRLIAVVISIEKKVELDPSFKGEELPYVTILNWNIRYSYIYYDMNLYCSSSCLTKHRNSNKFELGGILFHDQFLLEHHYSERFTKKEEERVKILTLVICDHLYGNGIFSRMSIDVIRKVLIELGVAYSYIPGVDSKKGLLKKIKIEEILKNN